MLDDLKYKAIDFLKENIDDHSLNAHICTLLSPVDFSTVYFLDFIFNH